MDAAGEFIHEENWKDLKRKKKKEKIHTDYYQFKVHKQGEDVAIERDGQEEEAEEEGGLDEGRLEDPDYLAKRKRELQKSFGKRVKQG